MGIRDIVRLNIVLGILGLSISTNMSSAKTLYVVDHVDRIRAFAIEQESLLFQAELTLLHFGFGAIDLAIDDVSDTLFVSYENTNVMGLVNSKTLTLIDYVELEGPSDLTGLVYDSARCRIYGTERNTNELYVYDWDPDTRTLTPDPNNPIELDNIEYACGVSLNGDMLYVSNYYYVVGETHPPYSSLIYAYDVTDDFSFQGTIEMDNGIVAIAHDAFDDVLYAGSYGGTNDTYIIKHNLDPNAIIQKDIGTNVVGLETNDDTGLVYITTYRVVGLYYGTIEVWDTSDWISDPNQQASPEFTYSSDNDDNIFISYLAGLVVGGPYKPSPDELTFYKTATIENGYDCIDPTDPNHDEVTYTIYFANPETDPCDPNYLGDVVIQQIVDHLPAAANPLAVTVTGGGVYNTLTNTVLWDNTDLGTLQPGDSNSVTVTIQIIGPAEPSGTVTNFVELESEEYYKTYSLATDVCCWGGNVIYVDTRAVGWNTGTSWSHAYPDLQNALARAGNGCGRHGNHTI